jgi:Putative DNA-binding domain
VQNIQQTVAGFSRGALAGFPVQPLLQPSTEGEVSARKRGDPIAVLAARYPVTRRLAGEPSFRVVARRFIRRRLPGGAIPHDYGDNFPRFLRSLGNAASIEYVADIAELEMLRGRARQAADVRPLAAKELSPLRTARRGGLRVVLHPSTFLVQSRFPIVTIWESNQTDDRTIDRWSAEAALVARPFIAVEVRRLPPGGFAFLRALSEGQTMAAAVAIATQAASRFEAARNLALLADANVVVGIQEAL